MVGKRIVFESFIKDAIKKSDARPFKAAEGITMMLVDPITGEKTDFLSKNSIIEVYKSSNIENGKVQNLNNNRIDSNNIMRFY